MQTPTSIRQLILALMLLAHSAHGGPRITRKITYSPTFIEVAPYTMQLRDENGVYFCAGTLVASQYVVTAAECFDKIDYTKAVVVAGAETVDEEGVQRKIAAVTKHPDYESTNKYSNIAVLKLAEPFEVGVVGEDKIMTLPLTEKPLEEGSALTSVGWRQLYFTDRRKSIFYSSQNVVPSQEQCEKVFDITPQDNSFCVFGSGFHYEFIVNDVGSPAEGHETLVGITTSCHNCDSLNYAIKLTDIWKVRSFIESAMK